jgi:hypothetical protein
MATITLGKPPKNFTKTVKFAMLDGTEGAIECVFKYRTVTAYGVMKDEMSKDAGVADPASDSFWSSFMQNRRDKGAELLALILDGWNLDAGFTQATLQQMADELPGAIAAIATDYELAIVQGRLGN